MAKKRWLRIKEVELKDRLVKGGGTRNLGKAIKAEARNLPLGGLVSLSKERLAYLVKELRDKFPPTHKKTKRSGEVGRADDT